MITGTAAVGRILSAGIRDERGKTVIFSVIAAVLLPFLLGITLIISVLSGAESHNKAAVSAAFSNETILGGMPQEYQIQIKQMQGDLEKLDVVLEEMDQRMEEDTLDRYQIKSIFYVVYMDGDIWTEQDYQGFADCFVEYEEREDEDGDSYTVVIPIKQMETVYRNLESWLGKSIGIEEKTNAQKVYMLAKYGTYSSGNAGIPAGSAMGDLAFARLFSEASRYIGYPYVWGGSSPSTSFDCSGYVCWVYTHSGVYNLPRTTAQGIFDQCAVVSREKARPGDLIFFTGTYASGTPVSHIGIYMGGSRMLHCGSPIGYADIDSRYWKSHFYAFGRLPTIPE